MENVTSLKGPVENIERHFQRCRSKTGQSDLGQPY